MKQEEIIQKNITETKIKIKEQLQPDLLIIFFTRILEDLQTKKETTINFYGRIKELYTLIHPYTPYKKEKLITIFKKSKLNNNEGLQLTKEEQGFIQIIQENIQEDGTLKHANVMKGRIKGIQKKLCEHYLPHTSKIIEPYILGKIISFVGGIKNLYHKPASTIQLLGAEKALYRHLTTKEQPPKYGLLYKSKHIQQEKNKGKKARQIANNITITIKQDYFTNFYKEKK